MAVTEAGEVYSFGIHDGRLGHGEPDGEALSVPKRIDALDGIHVATVAAGDRHALALTVYGRVYSWGAAGHDGHVYGLGYGSDDGGDGNNVADDSLCIPKLITALLGGRVRAVAAGSQLPCAVTDAGALYTWGRNDTGSLGHGDARDRNRPTLVTALHGIRMEGVSIHDMHTLALAADGSVYAFGEGPWLGVNRVGEEADAATHSPQRIQKIVCMVPGR
jgi:alpha-tubulin suppressor-like RCC1 family protein